MKLLSAVIAFSTNSRRTTGWGGISRQVAEWSGEWRHGEHVKWYEALLHIIKGKITCSWYTNHLQLVELCCSIIVYGRIRASILNMALCGTDIIRLWSTVSVFYVKDELDSWPAKGSLTFDYPLFSVVVPWLSSWPRTKIGVQSILECHPLGKYD